MEMSGSGATIGMVIILQMTKSIQLGLPLTRIACFEAVAGATLCRIVELLFVTASSLTVITTTLDSVSLWFPSSMEEVAGCWRGLIGTQITQIRQIYTDFPAIQDVNPWNVCTYILIHEVHF